ncbi:MAG: Gp37 family protein [Prevotellaceae bacterium]|jgi:hypothetical protein|nr:Gp37 family protein [Prevotellaceae bacterium]
MNYYGQYEDLLVERLQMEGVDIAVLPHVDAMNAVRTTTNPQLFVIINGGNFEEPENLAIIAQRETISCEIYIRALSRRGEMGIFDLYEKISRRLMGYWLPNAQSAITLNSFGYVAGVQNNWQYALTFSFGHYKVACPDEQETGTIKKITNNVDSL